MPREGWDSTAAGTSWRQTHNHIVWRLLKLLCGGSLSRFMGVTWFWLAQSLPLQTDPHPCRHHRVPLSPGGWDLSLSLWISDNVRFACSFACAKSFPGTHPSFSKLKQSCLSRGSHLSLTKESPSHPRQPLRGGASESINFPGKCIV